jgi:hypothetical protein
MSKSRVSELLKRINIVEAEKEMDKDIKEMDGHELVEYIKNEQWSDSPDHMKEAVKCMERMCEMADDEEVKSMMEFLDEASTDFDLEAVKEKKKKKK